jgi:UDPglucose 6-dehydrogenase
MEKITNICCIGAGYVGGPTMAVIALKCPEIKVTVVDLNVDRIAAWNDENLHKLPIYEPGLDKVIEQARGRNLFFSTDVNSAIEKADMIFISVNTPTKAYGKGKGMASDLKYVELCARQIAQVAKSDKIIVEKSTLPVRTADTIKKILENNSTGLKFQILSNPEFLAEGTAIDDLMNPDRILIGGMQNEQGKIAIQSLVDIYSIWVPKDRILTTNVWSSELSKLTANAFLAQRVSSINSISELCEYTGADISELTKAIGTDSRIGNKFLNTSVGFGGSCFQKDILNLVYIARSYGLNSVANYWEQVIILNDHQKKRFSDNIVKTLFNTISGKKITLFGWAFKKDTNDSRESPAINVADALLDEEANLIVLDPKVKSSQIYSDLDNLKTRSSNENKSLVCCESNPYKASKGSHAIAVLTDWDEFKGYDWLKIYNNMEKPAFIFDGRKILDRKKLQKIGFEIFTIGTV